MTTSPRLAPVSRLISLFSRGDEGKPGHSVRQIASGVLSAVAGRGIGVLANFFVVPLTVRYLGAERYGVWITLTSILAYLTIFDLGIGSTTINGVTEALANGDVDTARQRVNTAYLTLVVIALVVAVGISFAWPMISWPAILGDKSPGDYREITEAATVAAAIVLINFPLSATPRIFGACRKVTLSNIWTSFGSIVSLAAIVVATRLKTGLPGLVVAVSGATLVVGILSTVWLYRHFDWLKLTFRDARWEKVRGLLQTGLPFFAAQISGIILFQTDNVIIAQIMGAKSVTPYSITWKLFSYATLLQVVALPALWPAYADAFARRDFAWVKKAYRYNVLIAVSSTTAFVLIFLVIGRKFIEIWAGPAAVPTFGLLAGMGVWTIMSSFLWCESCLLGAAGRVKGQAIYSGIGAAVNIIVSVILGRLMGLVGIILGTLTAYLFCIIIPQTLEVRSTIKGKHLSA